MFDYLLHTGMWRLGYLIINSLPRPSALMDLKLLDLKGV